MGGASPYRARFVSGPQSCTDENLACESAEKYFGLVNLKNTCYVNSVLQALYFCTSFRRSAIRQLEEEDDPGGGSLLTSLAELFAQIENQRKSIGCLTPWRFLARLRKASDLFCSSDHQDAHEFLQFLLNDICASAKKRARRKLPPSSQPSGARGLAGAASPDEPIEEPRTWVHDILQGYLVNQMKCLCCETVTVRREEFFDLSVDIEQHTSIAACLRAFESTERLHSSNKFFCDNCGCLQEAEKRLRIYQLPSVLTLHLKRFKYVERLGRCCRLPYRVVFPRQLRIVEHRDKRRAGGPRRQQPAAAEAQRPASGEEAAQPPSRLFELRSVVVHIGRDTSYGHYVTVVRNGERCVLLDDDFVRTVEPDILRSFYGAATSRSQGATGDGRRGKEGGLGTSDVDGELEDDGPSCYQRGGAYERAPEGTCCGYLLIYEAVDQARPEPDNGGSDDWGNVTDWISEDHNFDDSDSDASAEERPGHASRQQPNACDDGELTQAFEQRCIPGAPGSRWPPPRVGTGFGAGLGTAASSMPSPSPSATPCGSPDSARSSRGFLGAFAWAAAEGDGSRAAPSPGLGGHGIRTLGSVVPAATGASDAVSLSRVNVVTVPSRSGSLEGIVTVAAGANVVS